MAKYDWSTPDPRFVESIAHTRSVEEARRVFGFPATLPESAALSAAMAETFAGSPVGVNVRSYGAKGDGVADDTVAMQAAHSTGAVVYYPAGTYKFSTITGILRGGIIGDGIGKTILSSTDVSGANLITFTGGTTGSLPSASVDPPLWQGFSLKATASKLTGAGIYIAPAAGESYYQYFSNVHIVQVPIGIDFITASRFKIIGCNIVNYLVAGVQVANTNNQDSGDSTIMGCVFENMSTGGAAIIYKSSAGLKVIGNKLNVGTYGVWVQWTGTGTGDLIIANNSVENMTIGGVKLARIGGASPLHNAQIIGNEFATCTDIIVGDDLLLLDISVVGNILVYNSSGTTVGIKITGATGVMISGNLFSGGAGVETGIELITCDQTVVAANNFGNVNTKTVFTTCTNLFDDSPYAGSTVVPNVTTTTAFALRAAAGLYEVFAYLPNSTSIGGTARLIADGTNLVRIGGEQTASLSITVSGLNVQLWQNSGIQQTLAWGYRRIA